MGRKIVEIENLTEKELDDKFRKLENLIIDIKSKKKDEDILLDRAQVAKLFHVSTRTLYNWEKAGILNCYSIANRIYYKNTDIEKALKKNSP